MDSGADLYERDFVAWTEQQAARLRAAAAARPNLPVDWEHVAEEIEDLGRALRNQLRSRLRTIIEHLLKLRYSPAGDPRVGWVQTVLRERAEVRDLLEENPGLKGKLDEFVAEAGDQAAKIVVRVLLERREDDAAALSALAVNRPTLDQVLNDDWFPERPETASSPLAFLSPGRGGG